MSDTKVNLRSSTHWLTPASESSVKSTGLKSFWSYGTYKTFTRWKPEKRLLLRCIAHLFSVISRRKTKNRPFSFDLLQLDSVRDDPQHVSIFCTETTAVFIQNPTGVSHLTYENANEDKSHQRTPASINLSQPLTFCIPLGERNHTQAHLQNLKCPSDEPVLFSSGYLITY